MESVCYCMVHMHRDRYHSLFIPQEIFTHRNLGNGISAAVSPWVTYMGELDPWQRGKMDDVLSKITLNEPVGHSDVYDFLGGLIQEESQIFKIGDKGKSEGAVIPINGGRSIHHIVQVEFIPFNAILESLCLVDCLQNQVEIIKEE